MSKRIRPDQMHLKPCPFCGETPVVDKIAIGSGYKYRFCLEHKPECYLYGFKNTTSYCTVKDAITAWNSRTDEWKTVDEECPRDGQKVLLTGPKGAVFPAVFREHDPVKGGAPAFDNGRGSFCEEPQAWMPLPERYKREEHEWKT